MDFRSLKRRELQVLCKKSKIPANLSNLEMASKLTELFQEKEKPSSRGWIKGQDDNKSGTESNVAVHRVAKKVRFSPEHELIEFTRSREKKRRSRRTSALVDNSLSVENVDNAGWKEVTVDCSVRVTRLREKLSVNGVLNRNKRGRNKVNGNNDRDNKVVDSVGIDSLSEEILDGPGRVTRSRGKKLVESLVRKKSRGEDNGITLGTRRSLRNRGVIDKGKLVGDSRVIVKNNEKMQEQILEDKVTAEENLVVARHNLSRRSKNKSKIVDYSEVCKHDTKKHENDTSTCVSKTSKSLAVEGLEAEAGNNGANDDVHGKVEANCQVDEPVKRELRRSSRRNLEIALHDDSGNHNFTDLNDKYSSNISVLHSETPVVSENDKKVIQPAGVRTRSRDTNLNQKAVSTDGMLHTDAMAHNSETAQQLIEPAKHEKLDISLRNTSKNKYPEVIDELGEDVVIQQKNQAVKRTRGHISGECLVNPNNDARPITRSKRKTKGNERTVSVGVVENFADPINLSNSLKEPKSLEDSSHKGLLAIRESLGGESQLSMPDAAEGSSDTNAKKLTCNKRLASVRNHHRKEKETSAAVGAGMKSIDVSESIYMAEDPAYEISDLQTDSSPSGLRISASKLMDAEAVTLLPRVSEFETIGRNVSDDNDSKPVLLVFGQSETFGDEISTGNQQFLEVSNIPGNLALETSFSADGLVLADLEVTEAKAEDTVQSNSTVLDHSQMKDISADENLETFEPINETILPTGFHVEGQNHMQVSNTADMGHKMGEAGGFESCGEGPINFTDSTCALELKEPSSGKLRISHESDDMTEGANFLLTNDTHSESDEAGESRNITDLLLTSDENIGFGESIPFDGEISARTKSQDSEMYSEYFIEDAIFHDPPVEVPVSMVKNSIGNGRCRNPEVCQIGEGYETSVHNHDQLELAETKEDRCLKDHTRVTDEAERLSASAQFDCQRGACIMPHDCVSCFGECSNEESGEPGTLNDSQDAVSTAMPSKFTDSKFTPGSPSSQEVNLSRSETSKSEEQLKSPLAEPIVTPNTSKCQEALSSVSETAGHTMLVLKTGSKVEVSNQLVDENANGTECRKEKDDFADAQTLDVPMSMGGATNQVNFENQDIDLNNLFGSPVDRVLPSGPKEASTHGVDKANMTISLTKSTTYRGRANFNEMNQKMEEVSEWEDHIPTNKSLNCPTTSKEEYDTGYYVGKEEYQLQFLFATPIKFVAPCKVDETSVCEKNAERAEFSFVECFGTTKENEVTKANSDEKVGVSGNELENYLGLGNLMLANGKDIRNPEINDLNNVEVENTCSYAVVSKTIYDANDEPGTASTGEESRESNFLTKEHVVDLENETINEDLSCKLAKTYSSTILSEAKYDGNEEQRIENTSECMKESNSVSEINEEDTGVERVNEVEMEDNFSSKVFTEATLDCKEKHWIGNTGECMKKPNSETEEIEEDFRKEEVIEIESFEGENIFSRAVFSEAKYDSYVEEPCTENTSGCTKESNSAIEKHREHMFSLGQSLFDEEATEGSAEMLLDFNLSENHSCEDTDYLKYEGEITRSSGDVYGIIDKDVKHSNVVKARSSGDVGITDNDFKQGNIVKDSHCFIDYHTSFSRGTLVDTFEKNLNHKAGNMGSFNGDADLVIHKDSPPCILSKVSHENDKVIEKDVKMASLKSHFNAYTLDINVFSTIDGIQKTCEERALHHHSAHNIITAAERVSTFWGDGPEMLQSLATHLFVEENECSNTEETNMETSNFDMKSNHEVDGGGFPQQFFMSEFHLEEDLKTEILTVSDSSANECSNEILEESHLANTMKECLKSEYSVAVLNDSGANLHNDLDESQMVTDERVAHFDDNDDKPSIGKQSEEPEESILFIEHDDGTAMNETLAGCKELNIKDDRSAAKKNARTILIHGTPNKLFLTDNMKENAPNTKRSQIGDYTTVRPTKRRVLQDVRWK